MMSIPVKIILDSGALLEDDEIASTFAYVEIGTFKPTINIYSDGKMLGSIKVEDLSGHQIEVRHTRSEAQSFKSEYGNKASGVTLASDLLELYLMRLPELYRGYSQVPIYIGAYDCIFRFFSGHIRSSMVKDRDFVEVNYETRELTGRRERLRQIAHDLVVEVEMEDGDSFELLDGGRVLWSSKERVIRNSLEIEVLADNSTAELFYHTALKLEEGQTYWLPNEGDPPPYSPYTGQSRRLATTGERLIEETKTLEEPPGGSGETDLKIPERTVFRDKSTVGRDLFIKVREDLDKADLDIFLRETETDTKRAVERYINLWFTTQRADEPHIPKYRSLVKDQALYLRLNIAPFDSRTILEEALPFISQDEIERAFPETKGKPVTLDVTLFSNDFEISAKERTKKLKLARDKPTETVYFRVTPLNIGTARLRVCVFYKNHLLQSLGVVATVAEEMVTTLEFQRAFVETTYSADFARVSEIPARGLWLGINQSADGTHALNIKGSNEALSRNLEDKIENALEQARKALLKVSFNIEKDDDGKDVIDERTGLPKKIYRFDRNNLPKAATEEGRIKRFRDDLKELAAVGRNLFDAVFGTGAVPIAEEKDKVLPLADKLKKLIRTEQVIQITRLKRLEDIWPWAMLYDLTIDYDRVTDVCLAYRGADGRALPFEQGMKGCKHRDPRTGLHKDKTVVCPYGFWGFRHIIEQPVWPGGQQAFSNLILQIAVPTEPILEMPLATELQRIEPDHITNMKASKFKPLESLQELEEALSPVYTPPDPHILYFFCHGKYDSRNNPYLQIGANEVLLPSELDEWDIRWSNPHGLVFINGCHTVDLNPKDLSVIMAPFVKAYASGIIGTEVTVHTFLACEFAQNFFKRLLPNGNSGQKVGTIIRDLRLELLMKYNPLGLVYTPYCSADLQFLH